MGLTDIDRWGRHDGKVSKSGYSGIRGGDDGMRESSRRVLRSSLYSSMLSYATCYVSKQRYPGYCNCLQMRGDQVLWRCKQGRRAYRKARRSRRTMPTSIHAVYQYCQ